MTKLLFGLVATMVLMNGVAMAALPYTDNCGDDDKDHHLVTYNHHDGDDHEDEHDDHHLVTNWHHDGDDHDEHDDHHDH